MTDNEMKDVIRKIYRLHGNQKINIYPNELKFGCYFNGEEMKIELPKDIERDLKLRILLNE